MGGSAHLVDYPAASGKRDEQLEAEMDDVRALVTLGRAAREDAGIRVRQPLPGILATLPGGRRLAATMEEILRDELNVREVDFPAADADIIRLSAKPDFGRLGPRFGDRTPKVARQIGQLDAAALQDLRDGASVMVDLDGEKIEVMPEDVRIVEEAKGDLTVRADGGFVVGLDTSITEELLAEGLAREVVSRVQRLRREAGLSVSDRIRLAVAGSERLEEVVRSHRDGIGGETLAIEIETGVAAAAELEHVQALEIDGERVTVALSRVVEVSEGA
jgi:isoleucyl-tRNA synthetase